MSLRPRSKKEGFKMNDAKDDIEKPDLNGLGDTLRALRRRANLTLKQLADRVGCSESMLSKIERGHVNPTLRMTHQLANELSVKVAALLTETTDSSVYIRAANSRLKMKLAGRSSNNRQIVLERATPYSDGSVLDANLHVVPPGMGSDGSYRHDAATVGYLVCGEILLEIDGVVHRISEGSSFFFDSRLPYGYRNQGTTDAKIFWVNGFHRSQDMAGKAD